VHDRLLTPARAAVAGAGDRDRGVVVRRVLLGGFFSDDGAGRGADARGLAAALRPRPLGARAGNRAAHGAGLVRHGDLPNQRLCSRLFAFSIHEGEASLFFYANRLMELPIGVFAIAVATVVYPLLAKHAAEKNHAALAHDYRRGLRLILLLNVPAAVGLAVLSTPIVRLLYERGKSRRPTPRSWRRCSRGSRSACRSSR